MNSLAQRILSRILQQELLKAGDRVGVAVSGGIDSVALLRVMLELGGALGIVLSSVHFNHKLRGAESDGDEAFVAELAARHGLEFVCDSDDVAGHAREQGVSLETAARELRYGFFRHLIRGKEKSPLLPTSGRSGAPSSVVVPKLDKIVTGHTLDDQAETVLMRVIRGAGLRGLGGIHPRIAVEDDGGDIFGEIVRPLLGFRRRELETYLKEIGQEWREDATNSDAKFTRNRVRKLVLPLLEKEFNPAVAENLAELAEIARGEEDYWENEVAGWMGTGVHWSEPEWARTASQSTGLIQIGNVSNIPTLSAKATPSKDQTPDHALRMGHTDLPPDDLRSKIESAAWLVMDASVDRLWFVGEPLAVQRRIVKAIGEHAGIPLEFKHVEEIVRFAEEPVSGKELALPLGWKVTREPDELRFVTPDLREPVPERDYEYEIGIPGEVSIPELGVMLELRRVLAGWEGEYNPEQLLNADSLSGRLRVRNWRAGDRFWPDHTKSPKKVKELLQERHVPRAQRRLWPVIVSGDEIVWLRGFARPAKFSPKKGRDAIFIAERTLAEDRES